MGRYVAIRQCVQCTQALTAREKMYSMSVCPYCGRVSGGTICDTKDTSAWLPSLWDKIRGRTDPPPETP